MTKKFGLDEIGNGPQYEQNDEGSDGWMKL